MPPDASIPGRYQVPRWLRPYWQDRPLHLRREVLRPVTPPDPVAVVGIGARLPMATELPQFWENLLAGKDCVTKVPADRWDWDGIRRDREGTVPGIQWGGFIDGVDEFDSLFFNISPREAAIMDPAHRLLLLQAWRAIEDAGYAPGAFAGTDTGVFLGALAHDYIRLATRAGLPAEAYTATGLMLSLAANRVSYLLDLRGPSEAIETACSTSLVAVHRAVCAIRNGECDVALAGGINLLLTPDLHLGFSRAGMLSPDGRCRPFSQQANGYVRGEGVGVVLLKRLRDAERDGDHVYCVIRATVENHGGRSRSLTGPNPAAQSDLLYRAYSQADIDPATIGYIETHGTGTRLGDPIEVEALKAAFDRLYRERGATPEPAHCGLGSLKSNLGHLELAAGIAGLIKVILQLRHQTLVGTLHCETINRYVVTEDTPFFIVRDTQPWVPVLERGRPLPRRAGVSSFGFGGVNAHVVVEEHRAPTRTTPSSTVVPIVLSARDPEALRRKAAALLSDVSRTALDARALLDLGFTLACGRDAMPERLGFAVRSPLELTHKLTAFLDGGSDGSTHRGAAGAAPVCSEEESVAQAPADGVLGSPSVADRTIGRWVGGARIDWSAVFAAHGPQRCPLAAYPFAPTRFPLPRSSSVRAPDPVSLAAADELTCRLDVSLTGEEFFLDQHRIRGERVLPAVMYLELVRRAAVRFGFAPASDHLLRFRNVRWLKALAVSAPLQIYIRLHDIADGKAAFEVCAVPADSGLAAPIHATGLLEVEPGTDPRLDVEGLRRRCSRAAFSGELCYRQLETLGFEYGPQHRAVRSLLVGEDALLVELTLSEPLAAGRDQFGLHPALFDGALQSIIGYQLASERGWRLRPGSMPFGCESVEVFAGKGHPGLAVVRACADPTGEQPERAFDVELCDRSGVICARLHRLEVLGEVPRGPAGAAASVESTEVLETSVQRLFLAPAWLPYRPAMTEPSDAISGVTLLIGGTEAQRSAILTCGPAVVLLPTTGEASEEELRSSLRRCGAIVRIVWLVPSSVPHSLLDDGIVSLQQSGVIFCLRLAQALSALGYGGRDLRWTAVTRASLAVHSGERANPTHAGLHGMISSMAKEYPCWHLELLDLPAGEELPAAALLGSLGSPRGPLAWRNRRWLQRRLCVIERPAQQEYAFAADSVYLIIGGTGGIAQAVSKALLERARVQLVWLGRRPHDAAIQRLIDNLAGQGPAPYYISADVGDRGQLERARDAVIQKFGRVDGLIHAAMVLRDQSIEKMSVEQLRDVLRAKVDGCVRLAQVFGSADLQFAVFFSSLNSFAARAGQGAYAAASCFEDAFARELAGTWGCRVRVVNWGYWGNVGAVASDFHRSQMARAGVESIGAAEGIQALQSILAGPLPQCGYLNIAASADTDALGIDGHHHLRVDPDPQSFLPTANTLSPSWQGAEPHVLAMQEPVFEAALVRGLWEQVRRWCDFGQPTPIARVRPPGGIESKFNRWLERSVDELIAHHYLERTDAGLEAGAAARTTDTAGQWSNALSGIFKEDVQREAQWQFAQTMLEALPDILTGVRATVDVMFSGQTAVRMAESYVGSPVVRYCDSVLAEVAAGWVARRLQKDSTAQIRIFEVGAGRGATTEWVVRALRPYASSIADYLYTDVSAAFLGGGDNPGRALPAYVTYRVFDVEGAPADQGIEPGMYDLVIAGNVLHATRDLEESLRNCKALLKGTGSLLLHELTANTVFAHLTYGLLDGWWRFEDHWLRIAGGPASPPAAWRGVLELAGFRNVSFPAAAAHALAHQVVAAESDGVQVLARPSAGAKSGAPVLTSRPGAAAVAGPLTSTGVRVSRETTVRELVPQLRSLVAHALGMEEEALERPSRPFAAAMLGEFGLDSLASIGLRDTLRRKFDVELSTQHILGKTPSEIADTIYEQLLLRQLVVDGAQPPGARSETFVF